MPGNNREIIYWDTCVFVAWLNGEDVHGQGVSDGIRYYADLFDNGKAILVSSAVTFTEVTETKVSAEGIDKFEKLFQRENIVRINLDERIGRRARNLRDDFVEENGKTLSTPDSIHLASGMIYGAKIFHTLDNKNKKTLGLLPLNGHEVFNGMAIVKPFVKEPTLDLET